VLDIIAADTPLLANYRQAYRQWRNLVAELQEAEEAAKRSHEDEDYWRFQYQQLAEAALNDEQEQETLEQEAEILEHAEDIREHLYAAQNLIDGNASDEGISTLSMLKQAIASLNHISDRYQQAESLAERIDSCYIELKDVADELEAASTGVEDNPERLMQVQERLNLIYTLQRKHHVDTLAELMAIRDDFGRKLDAADNSEERIAELKKQADEAFTKAAGLADQLTKVRTQAARKIETLMVEHLQELGMPNVRFSIQIGSDQERLMPSGADKVTFLFSANKNGELQNVSKVASGGEIARVMLSLKALIASAVQLPTIIFDEIDTGVSGKIAEKMAHIMNQMGSNGRQVISITHLPQIASLGSHHYKVFKEDDDDATHTHIVELDPQQRVEEIAHMLSGSELTEAALQNARALLGC
jgi:DNA repair protein RecN (Recombination protein N)